MIGLNLGCGDRYAEGWHNVDFGYPGRVDEQADLTQPLPLHWAGVTHIYLGHVLEHVTEEQAFNLLRRLRHLANPNGCLALAVGPDMDVAWEMHNSGILDTTYHTIESITQGGARWPGDVHLWQTTAPLVVKAFVDTGWDVVTDLGGMTGLAGLAGNEFWPVADRTPPWQYAVRAYTGTPGEW
jgi:predicted SAM-dependent methyltransferase